MDSFSNPISQNIDRLLKVKKLDILDLISENNNTRNNIVILFFNYWEITLLPPPPGFNSGWEERRAYPCHYDPL